MDDDFANALLDSTVPFKNISLNGIHETIYDFAAIEKNYQHRASAYLKKVGERTYYRRRPFPMM